MFESVVASLLNRTLGRYVDNLERSQLNLSILSGHVSLKGLALKSEALDALDLPIEITRGIIGELKLEIPWTNLKNKPVLITLKDVLVQAVPVDQFEADKWAERLLKDKLDKLATSELIRASAARVPLKTDQQAESFTTNLINKIIDNLQVNIVNIHVRFEERKLGFNIGICLPELKIFSTDKDGNEAFISESGNVIYKKAVAVGICIYSDSQCTDGLKKEEWMSEMVRVGESPKEHLLLQPVSGVGRVAIQKVPVSGLERVLVKLDLETLGVVVDDVQFLHVLLIAQRFILLRRQRKFLSGRPGKPPRLAPSQWLQFIGEHLLWQAKEKTDRKCTGTIIYRRRLRFEYIDIYRSKMSGRMSSLDKQRIDELERELSYNDIRMFRSIARSRQSTSPSSSKPTSPKQEQQSWWSYLFGSSESAAKGEDGLVEPKAQDVDELMQAIDYDEALPVEMDDPSEAKSRVCIGLSLGSLSLTCGANTVIELRFQDLELGLVKRYNSIRVEAMLGDLLVEEDILSNGLFRQLVRTKSGSFARGDSPRNPKFLAMNFDTLTDSKDFSGTLDVQMRPLEICANHEAIKKLGDYFCSGERGLAIESLSETAENNINRFKALTMSNVQFALSRHQAINLNFEIDAPIIFLPLACSRDDVPMFVIDLGSIRVRSKSIPQSRKLDLTEKYRNASVDPSDELFDVLYDQSIVTLSQARLFYAKDLSDWNRISQSCATRDIAGGLDDCNIVLKSIDLELIVGASIIKDVAGLVETRINGILPPFELCFSDDKWRAFMCLVDIFLGPSASEAAIASNISSSPSISSTRKSDDDDQFYDAIEDLSISSSSSPAVAASADEYLRCRVSVNLSFEQVLAKVRKSLEAGNEELRATIVAEKFAVRFDLFPKDVFVKVILEAFALYDNLHFSGFDAPILQGRNKKELDKSFLQVAVSMVDYDHPLLMEKYEGAQIHVRVNISDVLFHLEPTNFFTLIRYVVETFAEDDVGLLEKVDLLGIKEIDVPVEKRSLVKIQMALSEVTISMGRGDSYIGDFVAKKFNNLILVDREREMVVDGSLFAIEIANQRPIPSEKLEGRLLLSNLGKQCNLAQFKYQTFKPKSLLYDSSLSMSAGSLKFTFMPTFLRQVLLFVDEVKHATTIVSGKKKGEDQSKMLISVEIATPIIELVRQPHANVFRSILIYLGNIKLRNEIESDDKVCIFLELDRLHIEALTGPDLTVSGILSDTSLSLTIMQEDNRPIIMKGLVGDLNFAFGKPEYNLFISRVYFLMDTVSHATAPWFDSDESSVGTSVDRQTHDIFFEIPTIHINVLNEANRSETFADFKLQKNTILIAMNSNSSMTFELKSSDLSLNDPRQASPKAFPLIIPPLLTSKDRLIILYNKDVKGNASMNTTISNIECVFALNYIFALKSCLVDNLPPRSDSAPFDPDAKPMFQVYELVNLRVYLLDDEKNVSSEALKVNFAKLKFTSKDNASIIFDHVNGAFLNMDRPNETDLQFIEPFGMTCSIEYVKEQGVAVKTAYNLISDPIIIRLSYEDFLFVQSIWLQFQVNSDMSKYTGANSDDIVTANDVVNLELPMIGRERLTVICKSIRVVLIDDFSQVNLPFCDFAFESLDVEMQDWTAPDNSTVVNFRVVSNFFNLNNSHWEPIIEPCPLTIVTKRTGSPHPRSDCVVSAEKNFDLVLTQSLARTFRRLYSRFSEMERHEKVRTADRIVSKPYRIFNYTGYPLTLWKDADSDPVLQTIPPDTDIPWGFEDWRTSRRNLGAQAAKLSIQLLGSEWESVKGVAIDRIGINVYNLRPQIEGVFHKLSCEVILVGSIKHVFIRPSIVLKNRTKFPLRAVSENEVDGQSAAIDIQPNGYAAFPLKYSHGCAFRLKPTGLEYDLSTSCINVGSLAEKRGGHKKSGSVQVKSQSVLADVAPFYLLVYSKPLAVRTSSEYPIANLIIRAPVELHNLLPNDIRFRVYDLDAKFDFGGSVAKGKMAPLHAVRSDHVVGISVEIDGTEWKSSEVASMNCADQNYHDDELRLCTPSGNILNLRMILEYRVLY